MSRGPMPKPAELAQAQGNPGRRKLATTPADAPSISDTAPTFVRADDLALSIWEQLQRDLKPLGYVKQSDTFAMGKMAVYWAEWLRLSESVRENGTSYVTESQWGSYRRRNPDFGAWMQIGDKLQALMDRFGLTPAARQRINMQLAAQGRVSSDAGDNPSQASRQDDAGPAGLFAAQIPDRSRAN